MFNPLNRYKCMIIKEEFSLKNANTIRILRVMKSLALFLLISINFCYANLSYSQTTRLSLTLNRQTVGELFEAIENNSEYTFLYNSRTVDLNRKINISVKDETIYEVLDQLFADTDIAYKISGKQVFISAKETKQEPIQTKDGNVTVTGKVVDREGEPMIGVTLYPQGDPAKGTMTDEKGMYKLKASQKSTLIISYIGYVQQTLKLGTDNNQTLDIVLSEDEKLLDEVVVVGMNFRQTKRSVTGAMSTIETKELKQSPVANLNNALAGKIPGLMTVQTSGQPGQDAANMYIRGVATYGSNNAPLIVIDGLPRDQSSFSQIDPNEVESISILKDASSSALYGIQGANGVIVVTTKRGKKEQKPVIDLTVQSGILQVTRLPKPANAYEYASMFERPEALNSGTQTAFTDKVMERLADGTADPYLYPNVNWIDEILRKNSLQQQYNLNISGSGNTVSYFVSGSILNQETALRHQKKFRDNYDKKSGFERYNFRSNIDIQATSRLKVQVDLAARMEKQTGPSSGLDGIFNTLRWISPYSLPIHTPDGSLGIGSALQVPYWKNLYGEVTKSGYYENSKSSMYGTISASHELDFIVKGLSVQGFLSFENNAYSHTARTQTYDTFQYKGINDDGTPIYQQHGIESTLATSGYNTVDKTTYLDLRLIYQQTWGDHNASVQVLGNRTLRTANQELPYAYQGVSGRIGYGYLNRYFLEGNVGYNGSENFPKGNRYGFFPSGSLAWIASDESFLKDVTNLDYLKVRASIGMAGNDKIGGARWMYQTDYEANGGYSFGVSPTWRPGYSETRVGNPNVTWERSRKINTGFEIGLFKNRMISLAVDYFHERRSRILTTPGTVPDYLGIVNLSPLNTGVVENHGFDGELSVRKNWADWGVFATIQATYAKNKVIQNDQPTPAFAYQDLRGYPVGYELGYKSIGYFSDLEDVKNSPTQNFDSKNIPGDIKYADINNDGVIDPNDRIPVQRQIVPKLVGGLSLGFSYKGFDFSMLLNGAMGGKSIFKPNTSDKRTLANLWTENNRDKAKHPIPKQSLNNTMIATDFWLVSTDYLKLRNMEIGYVLPNFVEGVKYARVFLNGQNLAMWDKLWVKDRDPEVTADAFMYPIQRVINIGVNVKF